MKKSRSELKGEARAALLGNYGTACGAWLVCYLVSLCIGVIGWIIRMGGLVISMTSHGSGATAAANIVFTAALNVGIAILTIIFAMGQLRICYTICLWERGHIADILFALKHHPLRFLGVWAVFFAFFFMTWIPEIAMISIGILTGWMASCLIIGSLVSVVPAVWVAFTYSQAMIAMVEDPERTVQECFRYSRELMQGNRLRLAGLWISFIGMFVLGYLSMGIGFLWIIPYVVCTSIFFYFDLKDEKSSPELRHGETDEWR